MNEAVPTEVWEGFHVKGLGLRWVHETRHKGRKYYGYRRGQFRAPLGNDSEPYERVRQRYDVAHKEFCRAFSNHGPARKDIFSQMRRSAVQRAKDSGLSCEITADDMREMYADQRGCCALTGLPFSLVPSDTGKARPFAPSLDRLDNSLGYIKGNVRLVCCMANFARNVYTDEEFYKMCLAAVKTRFGGHALEHWLNPVGKHGVK